MIERLTQWLCDLYTLGKFPAAYFRDQAEQALCDVYSRGMFRGFWLGVVVAGAAATAFALAHAGK